MKLLLASILFVSFAVAQTVPCEGPPGNAVSVKGWVNKPGIFSLPLTVLGAIDRAGGRSLVTTNQAVVIRRDDTGRTNEIAVDLLSIASGRSADPILKPGDVLFIPTQSGNRLQQCVERVAR